ncbi:MAG: 1-deoxy-D-xylulose-5-phosphate synthase, partial [Candidatus Scalindua sp.]|nr:1-deoxy-D-xylulose-5-phosphate synthase [Candidatus Scalindua sp.]
MSNISQRDAFWTRIYEIARQDRDVVVISADMGAPALDDFRRDLPSQFVNVGIAEQNAILVASGLCMTGKKVFVYAIA